MKFLSHENAIYKIYISEEKRLAASQFPTPRVANKQKTKGKTKEKKEKQKKIGEEQQLEPFKAEQQIKARKWEYRPGPSFRHVSSAYCI